MQDTGVILGHLGGAAERLLRGHGRAPAGAARGDPARTPPSRASPRSSGSTAPTSTPNSGRIQINLKPLEERRTHASDIIRRLQPELAKVQGITLFLQPVQDLTVEDRVSRTQFQYSLEAADAAGAALWMPRLIERCRRCPSCATSPATSRARPARCRLVIDRDTASRFGITAADDRRHALRRLRPAAGLDDLHAAQPVPRGAGSRRRASSSGPDVAPGHLRAAGRTATQVPLSAFTPLETTTGAAGDQPPGAVPGGRRSRSISPRRFAG